MECERCRGNVWCRRVCYGWWFRYHAGVMPAGSASGVTLETPPGIAIRSVRLWLVARLQSNGSTLFAHTASGGAGFITPAVGLFGPPGGETLSNPFVSSQLDTATTIFYVVVSCLLTRAPTARRWIRTFWISGAPRPRLQENIAPGASIEGGTVLAAGPQLSIKTLAYAATDRESGIARSPRWLAARSWVRPISPQIVRSLRYWRVPVVAPERSTSTRVRSATGCIPFPCA